MGAIADGVKVTSAGSGLPSRVIFHDVEGIGKPILACHAPKPIFLMTRGETGLLSLIDNAQVPETDHFQEAQTWNDLKLQVTYLISNETGHKTLVIDTINGAERLCFEHVTAVKFGGRWENFAAYGRGPESALEEWIDFLTSLDRLRERRR